MSNFLLDCMSFILWGVIKRVCKMTRWYREVTVEHGHPGLANQKQPETFIRGCAVPFPSPFSWDPPYGWRVLRTRRAETSSRPIPTPFPTFELRPGAVLRSSNRRVGRISLMLVLYQ